MPCYLCLFWGLYKQLCSVLARGRGNMLRCMEPLGRRSKDHAPSFASANPSGTRAVLPIAEPKEPCLRSLPQPTPASCCCCCGVGPPVRGICRWWATTCTSENARKIPKDPRFFWSMQLRPGLLASCCCCTAICFPDSAAEPAAADSGPGPQAGHGVATSAARWSFSRTWSGGGGWCPCNGKSSQGFPIDTLMR